ncbi:hypothetical protein BDQ12DRAFT_671072 [Crucibulum laeve]|uniref:Uncharacterized protein n=1 Tax=Crucibulum laeve TaxID=68775 RepID=A0A5C3LIB3_9AGAR|nr:hypothetical protein BDQ12DRAFT_671072 [Crucibulum laeve]
MVRLMHDLVKEHPKPMAYRNWDTPALQSPCMLGDCEREGFSEGRYRPMISKLKTHQVTKRRGKELGWKSLQEVAYGSLASPSPQWTNHPAPDLDRATDHLHRHRTRGQNTNHKPHPIISLRLKSTNQLMVSTHHAGYYDSDRITKAYNSPIDHLFLSPNSGSSYIAPDEKLRVRLEVQLGKPEA